MHGRGRACPRNDAAKSPQTGRRRLWWPFRHRPRAEPTVVIRHAGPLPRMTLRERVVVRYRVWKGQRDIRRMRREHELPRFYKRAAGRDVDGLTINGASWTVGDFLPVGFDAHVRLPNPFWKIVAEGTEGAILHRPYEGERGEAVWAKPLHCAEVAAAHGLRMAHDTSSGAICGPRERARGSSPDALWNWPPFECNIDPSVAARLFGILATQTRPRDRCLCGQWDGGSHDWDTDVRLVTRGWSYFVWRARFRDVAGWICRPYSGQRDDHLPHIVWPGDRRWCLAMLYSGYSSYLGGSRALIDAVLHSDLEAYEVALTDVAH